MRAASPGASCVTIVVALLVALPVAAQAPKPQPRPAIAAAAQQPAAAPAAPAMARVASSPRPALRPALAARAASGEPRVEVVASDAGFDAWILEFAPRARRQGVLVDVLNGALSGLRLDRDLIALDRNQAEFSKSLWDYLDGAVSASRIANGRAALRRYATVLDGIEARYGVDKEVVVAVWGLESSYGAIRGNTPVIRALATLAYDGRRGDFFEEQLIAALRIIQEGDITPGRMTGSWAGAMGHTQFMPTSYLDYAVDFRGDGKRDIWSDDPTDALASTAAYLAEFGWQRNRPWGVEVRLPQGFDYALTGGRARAVADWTRAGVRGLDGQPVQNHGAAEILLPAGARGPAFMIFKNFRVIERYNAADSYVIAVGHLSDRLKGRPAFRQAWPRGDQALKFSERQEIQRRLTSRGFDTDGVDGRIGPNTIEAIRRFQASVGMVPDGYASAELLRRLR